MKHLRFLLIVRVILLLFLNAMHNLNAQGVKDSLLTIFYHMDSSDSLRAEIANDIAVRYIGTNMDSAKHYNSMAKSLAEKSQNENILISTELNNFSIYVNIWSIDSINQIAKELLNTLEEKNMKSEKLAILITLGAAYLGRGMNEDGIKYNLEASDLAEELGEKVQYGKTQYNLGAIYANMGMYEKAVENFSNAENTFEEIQNTGFQGIALASIANAYNNMGKPDSARIILTDVIALADSTDYSRLQSTARNTLGAILLEEGEYEASRKYFEEALHYGKIYGSTLNLANCHCNLGRVNYFLENYTLALEHLNQAYDIEVFKNNDLANQFCLKEMALTQQKLGNFEASAEYFSQLVDFQDSVLNKENKTVIAELEAKYENAKKETEIRDQQLALERKTNQQKLTMGGLGMSLLLGSSLIWGIYSRMKRNKKISMQERNLKDQKIRALEQEKQLLSLSSMLEGQENERIRIAKDLHDGLGGLLMNVKAHFSKIQSEIQKVEALDIYNSANKIIDKAHEEVRRISHNLMPADLRVGGLPIAIRQIVHELKNMHDINTDYELVGFGDKRLSEKLELYSYRIIQELTHNIIKHADARNVLVQLSLFEEELQIVVEDDGKGFQFESVDHDDGIGLKSIISRVDQLGGTMDFDTKPGQGTSVSINIPLS